MYNQNNKGPNQPGQNRQIPSQDASRAEARKERESSGFQPGQSASNRIHVSDSGGLQDEPRRAPSH